MRALTPTQRAALTAIWRSAHTDAALAMFQPNWAPSENPYWLCFPYKKATLNILYENELIDIGDVNPTLKIKYSLHYVVITDKGREALIALRGKDAR